MPVSRRRKPKKVTASGGSPNQMRKSRPPSPPWVGAMILILFLVGVAWLLTYYFSNGSVPGMNALGGWNIFVGFSFVVVGLGIATQWR